jgi:hypothetical protein
MGNLHPILGFLELATLRLYPGNIQMHNFLPILGFLELVTLRIQSGHI